MLTREGDRVRQEALFLMVRKRDLKEGGAENTVHEARGRIRLGGLPINNRVEATYT